MANCHQSCAALGSPLLMGRPQPRRSISMSLMRVEARFPAHGPNANKSKACWYVTQMQSIQEEQHFFINELKSEYYK
jgi:hypothetical protein